MIQAASGGVLARRVLTPSLVLGTLRDQSTCLVCASRSATASVSLLVSIPSILYLFPPPHPCGTWTVHPVGFLIGGGLMYRAFSRGPSIKRSGTTALKWI